ncbi:MAG TPA: S8 family peptidase [Candidatus Krumholzibacteria bacterium]
MRFRTIALIALSLVMAATVAPVHAATKESSALQGALTATDRGATVAVWVVFGEKHAGTGELRAAEAALTDHARARRARNRVAGSLVDAYDVPVSEALIDRVRASGVHVRQVSRWLNAVSVDATPAQVRALAALPGVAALDVVRAGRSPEPVEPVEAAQRTPAPPRNATQAMLLDYGSSLFQNQLIDVPAMHALGYDGSGVIIAVLDTGFNNPTHPAFANLDVMITHDFVNGDSVVADEPGQMGSGFHGTLVLGVIAGYAPGELIGPAYGATYILAKTENTSWERHIEEDAWVAAAEWADGLGADIIQSSLVYQGGFTNGETGYVWQDMDGATAFITIGADIAGSRGILVINAAGNSGFVSEPANTLGAPADGDMVLTVGATDAGGTRGSFSSVGNAADGRTKPDVMAMGVNVYTVSATDPWYNTNSGTSLAAPLVSGAAALVLQARPLASNVMIMNALRNTATNAGAPNRLIGWGVIDALAARNYIASGVGDEPALPATSLVAYPNPFNPATTIEYTLATAGRVTLSAYDAAGRRVATLVDEAQTAGVHRVRWNAAAGTDGRSLPSGVYLLKLTTGDSTTSRKVVLLK